GTTRPRTRMDAESLPSGILRWLSLAWKSMTKKRAPRVLSGLEQRKVLRTSGASTRRSFSKALTVMYRSRVVNSPFDTGRTRSILWRRLFVKFEGELDDYYCLRLSRRRPGRNYPVQ